MNALAFLSIVALLLSFGVVFAANSAEEGSLGVPVPYVFVPGDWLSIVNSFFFVFLLSLLFFGFGGPVAMGFEGAKYAYFFVGGQMSYFDIVFVVPQLLAVISASVLGQGAIDDYRGKGSVFVSGMQASKFFALGVGVLVVLLFLRPFLVGFF
ncbi:MAG: hypothetical protein ACE5DI_01775 [Candidatus Micrarchaeia archaeon]